MLFSLFVLCYYVGYGMREKDVVLSIFSTFLWQLLLCSFHLYYLQIFFIQSSILEFGLMFVIPSLLISLTIVYSVLSVNGREQQHSSPVFQHQRLWSFFNGTKIDDFFFLFIWFFSVVFLFLGVNALCYCYFLSC